VTGSGRVSVVASEAKRLVALVEPVGDSAEGDFAPKSDGAGHLNSAGGGAGGGGVYDGSGGAGAGEAAAAGLGWKNCVKPPSTDAESEAPEEKPFIRGAPGEGAGAGDKSGSGFDGAGAGAAGLVSVALTKMRVNSPGAGADESGAAGAAGGKGRGSKDGAGGAAEGADEPPICDAWNNFVNSPGPPCELEGGTGGAEGNAVSAGHAGDAGAAKFDSTGFCGWSASLPRALKNIPVALSGSASSLGLLSGVQSVFVIGSVSSALSRHHYLESLHGHPSGVKRNDAALEGARKRSFT
jgi:hypothetical protein